MGHVIDLLQSHKPSAEQTDLRRFEWYYLWRLCQRSVNATKLKHIAPVELVACSADGSYLASAAADESGTVEIQRWHTDSRKEPKTLKLKLSVVASTAAFSKDVNVIVLATSEGTVRVWDLQTGAERTMLAKTHGRGSRACAFPHRQVAGLANRPRRGGPVGHVKWQSGTDVGGPWGAKPPFSTTGLVHFPGVFAGRRTAGSRRCAWNRFGMECCYRRKGVGNQGTRPRHQTV